MVNTPSLLGSRLLESVKQRIKNTAERYFNLNEIRLTENELIQAFILPEHVPVLMQANTLCGGLNTSSSYKMKVCPENDPMVRVSLRFRDEAPIPIPTYVDNGLSDQCPALLRDRITAWITDRINAGDMLGDLCDAITVFDRTLPDLRSFAIMVPCLPMIVQSLNEKRNERVLNKLNKGTNFSLPRLPPEVVERVQKGNAFYIGLSMITASASPRSANEIWLERANYSETRMRPHVFSTVDQYKGTAPRRGTSL